MKIHVRLAVLVLATMALLLSAVARTATMPSDAAVLRLFAQHKVEFERLRKMVTEDSANESIFSEAELSSAITEARRTEYRALIDTIDPTLLITVDYGKSVRFILARNGSSTVGPDEFKGLGYIPDGGRSEGRVLPNLDRAARLEDGLYVREIDNNWRIIYQRTD